MAQKHTPGPWHYYSGSVWTTPEGAEDGGVCIARRDFTFPIPGWERDGNLKLCAAAPDLAEALADLVEYARDVAAHLDERPACVDRGIAALRKAGVL